jgi:hypothetical protein
MTDENRELGQIIYDMLFPVVKDLFLYCELPQERRDEWNAIAEAVAKIAHAEGYRAGLERAAKLLEARFEDDLPDWIVPYDITDVVFDIRALKDEKR